MSITIVGFVVALLVWLSQTFGLNFTESDAEATVKVVLALAGLLTILYGRLRIGDLKLWGGRK